MNIQLQIDEDDEPLAQRPLGPPPNYQSRGFRLRLMTLFAALVLVLVLMKEAGKPERWAWMGFDRAASQGSSVANTEAGEVELARKRSELPPEWENVQDNTAVGHVGDSQAWADAWRRVDRATLSDLTSAEEVQRIQLMSQPQSYRGSWVKLRGWVRSARFVDRPIAALGQDAADYSGRVGHYEFWVRPEETNAGPYCVYALSLPAGFPDVSNSFQDLNEKVEVAACFFKNRVYVAADSEPSTCPLLLAASFTRLNSRAGSEEEIAAASTPWIPSFPVMVGIAIAFAMLAAGLAWLAKKTSQSPRYQPGVQTTERIHDSLDQLTDDPGVMTDREKVLQLHQTVDESGSTDDDKDDSGHQENSGD